MSDPNSEILEPEDSEPVNSTPASAAPANDADTEVPVPVAMEPAEIDERAQVIEALNRSEELP
jgi:hypothetical protein